MRFYSRPRRAARLLSIALWLLLFASACGDGPSEATSAAAGPSLVKRLGTRGDLEKAVGAAAERLMLIDLYADWCAPCRHLSPILEALAREHAETVQVYKVNVDQSEELARYFAVRGIPHVAFVRKGQTVLTLQGLQPKANYEKAIRKFTAQGQ